MVTKTKEKPKAELEAKVKAQRNGAAPIEVRVASLPGEVRQIVLKPSKASVADALQAYGFKAEAGGDVRVNNRPSELDRPLEKGDIVTVVGRVNGG